MSNPLLKLSAVALLGLTLACGLSACGDQGYGATHSYSARYDPGGTAADAASNNGSVSSTVESQRRKMGTQYGY